MKFNPLGKTIAPFLKKGLDGYALRHSAIAENIANTETENYRPIKVSFEEKLRNAMRGKGSGGKKTNPRHMDIGNNIVTVEPSISHANEKVNIEGQMAELAVNQIKFEFTARILVRTYEGIRASIIGRVR